MKTLEQKAKMAAYMREWRKRNPEKAKDADLKKNYGIGFDDYKVLLAEQQGACAVCRIAPGFIGTGNAGKGTLAVDHCHTTGTYRGLLCTNCNLGIGSFFENPDLLIAAADYVKKHRELVVRLLEQRFKTVVVQNDLLEDDGP